jgi:hypothetical protein
MILHRDKVFGKQSSGLLSCFFKLFTMAHLPIRQMRAEGCRLQHELRQADHCLHPIVVIKEP